MSKNNNGGPAFPISEFTTGITTLDYFAAAAMQARMTAFCAMDIWHGWTNEQIAQDAYELADAMLAERQK